MMATRWNRYYGRQMADPEMKELVERELANLRLGAAIARMRQKSRLTQTQLAARTGMSASKIAALESSPKNLELRTLIRLARALGYQFKPEFVPVRARKRAHSRVAASAA